MKEKFFVILLLLISFTFSEASETNSSAEVYIRNYTAIEYGASRQNWAALQDRRGIMYFGNSDGILEFDGTNWNLISLPDNSGVYCLELDSNGRIYVGGKSEFGYLAPAVEGSMDYISFRDKIPEKYRNLSSEIFSIEFTSEGVVFIADQLMYILSNETVKVIQTEDYFFSSVVIDQILNVIDGAEGLMQLKDGKLESRPESGEFRSFLMLPFIDNNILISLPDGKLVTQSTDSKEFSQESFSALPAQDLEVFKDTEIRNAVLLSDNCIVLGTTQNGCFIINPEGAIQKTFNKSNGLGSDNILGLCTDNEDDIWLCTGEGISFINLDCIYINSPHVGADSNKVASDGGKSDSDQKVFTAMIRQIVSTNNDSLIFGGAFYKTVGGVQVLEQQELLLRKFPYDRNAFRISYSSNHYKDIEKIEYQTYLEGLEDDWLKWSNRTWREFTSLYWGKYTFHVRARNADGEISEEVTYSFIIKPPWFEAWWFYASQIVFVLMLLVISGYLSRYGKAEKLSDSLSNIVVIIVFKYTIVLMGPFLGIFSAGIGFFKVIMNVALAFILLPSQKFMRKHLQRLTRKRTPKEISREAEKTSNIDQKENTKRSIRGR